MLLCKKCQVIAFLDKRTDEILCPRCLPKDKGNYGIINKENFGDDNDTIVVCDKCRDLIYCDNFNYFSNYDPGERIM